MSESDKKYAKRGRLHLLNWNVGGSKYLESKSKDSRKLEPGKMSREEFREKLNEALSALISTYDPDVITLQEVVKYSVCKFDEKAGKFILDEEEKQLVIDIPENYKGLPHWLIDTEHHNAQGKWNKVRTKGEWPDRPFFAQGNVTLVKKTLAKYPVYRLPATPATDENEMLKDDANSSEEALEERVQLETGLYFGDRDTEPRAAIVTHIVLDHVAGAEGVERLNDPLDVFVLNLHLTTLSVEREGVPQIDEAAAITRQKQLDIVLDGIVSRYNRWRKDGYPLRGNHGKWNDETHKRYNPIWIIAGDFNFTPESKEYETLIRRGFIDLINPPSRELPAHRKPTKAKGMGENPSITLDYIFAGPRFEALNPKYIDANTLDNQVSTLDVVRVSDHYPLVYDLPIGLEGEAPHCERCEAKRKQDAELKEELNKLVKQAIEEERQRTHASTSARPIDSVGDVQYGYSSGTRDVSEDSGRSSEKGRKGVAARQNRGK